jgi:hypothetical protein
MDSTGRRVAHRGSEMSKSPPAQGSTTIVTHVPEVQVTRERKPFRNPSDDRRLVDPGPF